MQPSGVWQCLDPRCVSRLAAGTADGGAAAGNCGSGFELVLNVTVPQMGRKLLEAPKITFEQIVGNPARGGPAPVVESISHAAGSVFAWLSSTSHPLQHCFKH